MKRTAPARRKFTLRLSDDLAAKLYEAADQSQRSVNAEIIHRLRRSLEGYTR